MQQTNLEDLLVSLYEEGGQSAVYDWVNDNHPDWPWKRCEPCDCESPVWEQDNGAQLCAVCFTHLR